MKVYYRIDIRNGLYVAQVEKPILTAIEESKVEQFGEPEIQVGGTFTGTISRPGYTTTTLTVTGGGGSGANLIPVLNAQGGIESVVISSAGSGYVSVPTIGVTGASTGTGAALTAVVLAGAITAVTVAASGYGYQMTPANVNFTLPSQFRRMLTDFPINYTFSLYDSYDADAQAEVWVQTVQTNLINARNMLLTLSAPLEGENLQTV